MGLVTILYEQLSNLKSFPIWASMRTEVHSLFLGYLEFGLNLGIVHSRYCCLHKKCQVRSFTEEGFFQVSLPKYHQCCPQPRRRILCAIFQLLKLPFHPLTIFSNLHPPSIENTLRATKRKLLSCNNRDTESKKRSPRQFFICWNNSPPVLWGQMILI